jgi:hypothetical protein
MAKKTKRATKSRTARASKKPAAKKKVAKKASKAKRKAAPKKKKAPAKKPKVQGKAGGASVKKAVQPAEEETPRQKVIAKPAVPLEPKDEELDGEIGDEELEMSGEGEMEEEIEEDLPLDDEDEDVDYLEKSEDLLDDSDDYRTH